MHNGTAVAVVPARVKSANRRRGRVPHLRAENATFRPAGRGPARQPYRWCAAHTHHVDGIRVTAERLFTSLPSPRTRGEGSNIN
jgi:hypothetical protein